MSAHRKSTAAVVGVGHSKVYRRDEEPLGRLAVDACRRAIEDAGLEPHQINGITGSPAQPFAGAGDTVGLHLVTTGFLIEALGLNPCWSDQGDVLVTQTFVQGVNAVAAGACDYCLVYRALHNPSGRYGGRHAGGKLPTGVAEVAQFRTPYGELGPTQMAILQRSYMEKYGATREQLGRFVVRNRENALAWEHGYWFNHRPETFSLDAYMGARIISDPIGIYDCDLPVQGAGAFVLTSTERAVDLRHPPAYVLGTTISPMFFVEKMLADTIEEYMEVGRETGGHLYRRCGIGPADVDVVNLYDGFSAITPFWAECLDLCGEGEGFAWVADPTIPLNTSSGNLGAGRMHGVPQLMDGALQVMGRSGSRQVKDAEISLVAIAPSHIGGAVVFSRSPK